MISVSSYLRIISVGDLLHAESRCRGHRGQQASVLCGYQCRKFQDGHPSFAYLHQGAYNVSHHVVEEAAGGYAKLYVLSLPGQVCPVYGLYRVALFIGAGGPEG